MQKLSILALLLSLPCFLNAQPEDAGWSRRKAFESAKALKEGVLVVCLPSNNNKIKALSALLDNPQVNENEKKRIRKQLTTTESESRSDNLTTIVAFRQEYRFSEVYFTYDTAITQLRKGIPDGYFLNDALETDPGVSLTGKTWFVLRMGYTDATQNSGAEAFILSDSSLNELQPPFPAAVRLDNLSYLINRALAPEIAARKRMTKAARKLQEKLSDFYGNE
ncbi:MAG: hypothetical protein SH848_20250 [Saprospiraceae bacterium]|nr:hypothetical protein [Saprospiraceae bacterium]MDZ4706272.1 hypothetical protein [Saprospiraceae bacterium]